MTVGRHLQHEPRRLRGNCNRNVDSCTGMSTVARRMRQERRKQLGYCNENLEGYAKLVRDAR